MLFRGQVYARHGREGFWIDCLDAGSRECHDAGHRSLWLCLRSERQSCGHGEMLRGLRRSRDGRKPVAVEVRPR